MNLTTVLNPQSLDVSHFDLLNTSLDSTSKSRLRLHPLHCDAEYLNPKDGDFQAYIAPKTLSKPDIRHTVKWQKTPTVRNFMSIIE